MGKAKNLKKRVSSYFNKSAHDAKTTLLVQSVHDISYVLVSSEIEAFLLEAELIKKYKPYYNIKMIDDKSYPYIMITSLNAPYVSIVRKKSVKKATYFGPFPDAGSVKVVLKLLRRIFPYQSVKNHTKRKCLYFHLGLCPCVEAVPSNLIQYKKNLSNLKRFLKGNTTIVKKALFAEQKKSIKHEKFEDAALLQDQIDSINKITQETYSPFIYLTRPHATLEREKKENEALKDFLISYGLDVGTLARIECYDMSNFQGTNATGSMTVFINGSEERSEYRKFKIRSKSTPDDFAMHKEVMERRLRHSEWDYPNLFIIDGGKGQVSSIMQVFASRNIQIPVIGLAKRLETFVIPQKIQRGYEFLEVKIPNASPALNLARRIRDEAHRFAITYHKTLRSKSVFK